jgi:hypothetical protein
MLSIKPFLNNRKSLLLIAFALLAVIGGLTAYQLLKKPKMTSEQQAVVEKQIAESEGTQMSIYVNFDGKGPEELVYVKENEGVVNLVAYDSDGSKLAELSDELTLYPTSLYSAVNLNQKKDKEYLQWTMMEGPRHTETVFLTLQGDKLVPVYSVDFEKNVLYAPFYNSNGSLLALDINGDGLLEIYESIDEYPSAAPRLNDTEAENAVLEYFSGENADQEFGKKLLKVIKRENYGEGIGKRVIMSVHRFVDGDKPHFEKLSADEYESVVGDMIDELDQGVQERGGRGGFMRYTNLSQDSKDFNNFVRALWTFDRVYEKPLPDDFFLN